MLVINIIIFLAVMKQFLIILASFNVFNAKMGIIYKMENVLK